MIPVQSFKRCFERKGSGLTWYPNAHLLNKPIDINTSYILERRLHRSRDYSVDAMTGMGPRAFEIHDDGNTILDQYVFLADLGMHESGVVYHLDFVHDSQTVRSETKAVDDNEEMLETYQNSVLVSGNEVVIRLPQYSRTRMVTLGESNGPLAW